MEWAEWHGEQAKALVKQAGIRAFLDCGEDLKGKSQDEAPVDLGDLKGNCSDPNLEESAGDITVTVGYSLPYALRQHEHTEYNHPKGGKAKYLEDPYKRNESRYLKFIGESIKETLGD
jgi:hypothetical protein